MAGLILILQEVSSSACVVEGISQVVSSDDACSVVSTSDGTSTSVSTEDRTFTSVTSVEERERTIMVHDRSSTRSAVPLLHMLVL